MNEKIILGNMASLVNNMYLLSQLTTGAFDKISKQIKEQAKFNRGVILISVATTACILVMKNKIEELSDELEELKQTRGE